MDQYLGVCDQQRGSVQTAQICSLVGASVVCICVKLPFFCCNSTSQYYKSLSPVLQTNNVVS